MDNAEYYLDETGIALPTDIPLFQNVQGFVSKQVEYVNYSTNYCAELGVSEGACGVYNSSASNSTYLYFYPNDDTTQYLYETFPEVISPIEGVTNEHFITWMRVEGLPTFRKLYGRINNDISAGTTLRFVITANFAVDGFQGSKALILTNGNTVLGGQNPVPGIVYIATGICSLVLGVLMATKELYKGSCSIRWMLSRNQEEILMI